MLTGKVKLDDFLNERIEYRCNLTGNLCSPLCFITCKEKKCKERRLRVFCYHIGLVYVLLNLHYTNVIYDRNFDTILHTGKQYIDYIDNWEPYDLYTPIEETKIYEKIKIDPIPFHSSSVMSSKYPQIQKKLITEIRHKQQKQLENINKIAEEYKKQNKKIPHELLEIKRKTETFVKSIHQIEMSTLLDYVYKYISRKYDDEEVIKEIIRYIITDFTPANQLDFPLGDIRKRRNLMKLVDQTKYLDEKDTRKWTAERVNAYEIAEDPYIKYMIMNDTLYTWYKYIVPSAIIPKEKQIRTAFLVYKILSNYTQFLNTNIIVFGKLRWYELLRIKKVLKWIDDIATEEINMNLIGFITEEMLKNQGCVTQKFTRKDYLAYTSEIGLNTIYATNSEKFMDIMIQKKWIRRINIVKRYNT